MMKKRMVYHNEYFEDDCLRNKTKKNSIKITIKNTILLIEDNILVQTTSCDSLKLNGFKVYTANNGKIGVNKALKIHPDLILMDMEMPIMDGYEATLTLRNQGYKGLIAAFTGKTQKTEIIQAIDAGCIYVFKKPIMDIDKYINTIRRLIARPQVIWF